MNPVNIDDSGDLAICKSAIELFESIKESELDFGATARKYGVETNTAKVNSPKSVTDSNLNTLTESHKMNTKMTLKLNHLFSNGQKLMA